eukprot:Polyplicarium_translucidae@DN3363_c1_g1_i30.p1
MLALEVAYLQDVTNSVRPYLDVLKVEVPDAFRELQRYYPVSSFALVAFDDRPKFPGSAYYWSYGLDADVEIFDMTLEQTYIRASDDCGEMTMSALLELANDDIGFTTTATDAEGRSVYRVILVATTDLPPMSAGLERLAPRRGGCSAGRMSRGSRNQPKEFWSYEQLAAKLNGMDSGTTHLAFAVPYGLEVLWQDAAATLSGLGVPTSVHLIHDVMGMIRSADPDGRLPEELPSEVPSLLPQ